MARKFVTRWREPKHIESLILRDAERYLWARAGVKQFGDEFLVGSSVTRTLSKPVHATYDALKIISIITASDFLKSNPQLPFSARGGYSWFKLGLEHWDIFDKGRLDSYTEPRSLTCEDVIQFQQKEETRLRGHLPLASGGP